MPKVVPDGDLQTRVKLYIEARGISVRTAAERLGVSNSSLSRFCKTGMALDAKRLQYQLALDREVGHESETDNGGPAWDNRSVRPFLMDDRELRRIRQVCESVIKLLDAYESSLGVKPRGHH